MNDPTQRGNTRLKKAPPCPFSKKFPSQLNKDDDFYMQLAYNQAIEAWKKNEVPIGAVIVKKHQLIGSAFNQVESQRDPTAHAEVIAITQAAQALGDWRLNGSTLYVTKEPCPMCSGAIIMARVSRVVYALKDPKMGCLGGTTDINELPDLNHHLQYTTGVLEEDCRQLLQTFFALKREDNDNSAPFTVDPSDPDPLY